MNLLRVIEVCFAREGSCNNCEYRGKTCEHTKQILRVDKPLKYIEQNEKEIQRKENH